MEPKRHLRILLIRGKRVLLDADLATIYGTSTRELNQSVRRNIKRFPANFMFQLTESEAQALRSQFVISNRGRGGRRYMPHAFTEHGAVMLASVLNSEVAIRASIQVVEAFIELREMLEEHRDLAKRLDELERRYDGKFKLVFAAIRELMEQPADTPEKPKKIEFNA